MSNIFRERGRSFFFGTIRRQKTMTQKQVASPYFSPRGRAGVIPMSQASLIDSMDAYFAQPESSFVDCVRRIVRTELQRLPPFTYTLLRPKSNKLQYLEHP